MAQLIKKENITIVTGTWNDAQGNEKKRYKTIAELITMQGDDGNSNSESSPQKPVNKSAKNSKQDDDKPWYDEPDYQADLESVTAAIRSGTPPDDVIKEIANKFKIANKYRDLIKAI